MGISVARRRRSCGYHRSGAECHTEKSIAPTGFCPALYHAVYPYLLALLYDARLPFVVGGTLDITCPESPCSVVVAVGFEFKPHKALLNLIERVGRSIGFPKDAIDKVIKLRVVRGTGVCGLEAGREFRIRIPDAGTLCPASFFSLYPLAATTAHTSFGFWQEPGGNFSFSCPDPRTDIVYDLARPPADGSAVTGGGYLPDLSRYTFRVTEGDGCDRRSLPGERTSLDTLVPEGLCPYLFNVAIPYALTLRNGGHFKWRRRLDDVEAQCPNPFGGVTFTIQRGSNPNDASLRIGKVRGCCRQGHAEGATFSLTAARGTCPDLFVRIFPRLLLLEYGGQDQKEGAVFSCPFPGCGTRYRLERSR